MSQLGPGRQAPSPLRLRRRGAALLALSSLAFVAYYAKRAEAAWPPPLSATASDMKDPANWPNDPGYAYAAAVKASDRREGQWEMYSFIPDRSPVTKQVRPAETASGMSVDLAWRHTIGDPRVVIAVLDSGIKWDEREVVDKVHLNRAELGKAGQLPVHSNGDPCDPLDPTQPTVDLFDCNGDGQLTVADYADHPGVSDLNANGVRDAGDLIHAFSDGVDDDGNGYVDDIAGWDFMKDDNDPYDDTRYGHGTGEARDSVAATNNGQGGAGMCPLCTFIPMRVGDSFIANVQDYAQAVVYATDRGAKVVQEALGTINMSDFTQEAHDYAWSHGVVIVASMADENARHHNMPAVSNHTMPAHAIYLEGSDQQPTTTASFLAFNNCSNYGAHNFLSVSATPCSSEAVGNLAGLSGLVYSAALAQGYAAGGSKPPLTAGEVMQIFTMGADDIDVPESRDPGSIYRWSQPGFDQRFGYGRVNANTAVEAVLAGKIPPDVDVVRPYWYEVLYADQVQAPVPIAGTVSAKRSNGYDVTVEWAPGVQPEDSAFQVLRSETNLPAATVLGGDGTPLAELDIRNLDVTHEADIDSPLGENRYTITVRVRSVAHYGGTIGDVRGELRRAYYVHSDPDMVAGFPAYLGGSAEGSPKIADVDGDGVRDLVVGNSNGELHVWQFTTNPPAELPGFPFKLKNIDGLDAAPAPNGADYRAAPGYASNDVSIARAGESISNAAAIADIDGDGTIEIAVASFEGTVYVIESNGTVRTGWPKRLPDVPSCAPGVAPSDAAPCMDTEFRIARGSFAAPVLANLDADADLELVQAAFDGRIYAFNPDGSTLAGWPVKVRYPNNSKEFNRILTTPAVADFNGDGQLDVLTGSNERLGAGDTAGAFYVIDGRGNAAPGGAYLPHWPISISSFNIFPVVAEGTANAGVAGDIDGDGKVDAVFHGNVSSPMILPGDPGQQGGIGTVPPNAMPERVDPESGETVRGLEPSAYFGAQSKAQQPDTMFPLFAQPSLGDLDQDGTPDVIAQGGSLSMAQGLLAKGPSTGNKAQHLLAAWSGKTGKMFPGSPMLLEEFSFFNSQAVADVSGDDYPEILAGSAGYYLHAVDACGREAAGWPKFTGQWITSTPSLGDLDGDGSLEVAITTRSGWLYVWHTAGRSDGVVQWESYHHDARNTGDYSAPLTQGTLKRAGATPLEIDAEGKCVLPVVENDGGTDGGSGGDGGVVDPPKKGTSTDDGGCGCSTPGAAPANAWLAALAFVPLVTARRRRRAGK